MKLICIDCGNYTYFAADIEMQMAAISQDGSVLIENAEYDSYDYTSDSVRRSLDDLIGYVLKIDEEVLSFNGKINRYENRYITCVWCGSSTVTPPTCEYIQPSEYQSIDEEINSNKNEYLRLKKEGRKDAYLLPEHGLQ